MYDKGNDRWIETGEGVIACIIRGHACLSINDSNVLLISGQSAPNVVFGGLRSLSPDFRTMRLVGGYRDSSVASRRHEILVYSPSVGVRKAADIDYDGDYYVGVPFQLRHGTPHGKSTICLDVKCGKLCMHFICTTGMYLHLFVLHLVADSEISKLILQASF